MLLPWRPCGLDVQIEAADVQPIAAVGVVACQRDRGSGPITITDRSDIKIEVSIRLRGYVGYTAAVGGEDRIQVQVIIVGK